MRPYSKPSLERIAISGQEFCATVLSPSACWVCGSCGNNIKIPMSPTVETSVFDSCTSS